MTIKAKPVLKDKFWIVENNNERIGTLSWNDDRFMFSNKIETCFFDNENQINKRFGYVVWGEEEGVKEKSSIDNFSHGYPTSVTPYNNMYDVKRKLPLFTKSNKSKSAYCAGYYIIRFDKGWVKSFCPKLITLDRYKFKGPFKTELEMRQELRYAKS